MCILHVMHEALGPSHGHEPMPLLPAQICVWSTGNAARPLVQAISAQIPEQKATMEGRNSASTKLAVDPFLRIEGATDAIALGDCSRMSGRPLPATAQVCPFTISRELPVCKELAGFDA